MVVERFARPLAHQVDRVVKQVDQVHNTGDTIAITLHVYGADLRQGTSVRRSYELRNDTRAVGEGLPVFKDLAETLSPRLVEATPFPTGALGVVYQPA